MRPVGVLTVDDQPVFLDVAREVIDATPGFRCVGETTCAEEALEAVESARPDLVLLDVRMPGIDGFEAARRITEVDQDVVVVLISTDEVGREPAPSSGAAALRRKQDFGPTMLRELWAAHGGPTR